MIASCRAWCVQVVISGSFGQGCVGQRAQLVGRDGARQSCHPGPDAPRRSPCLGCGAGGSGLSVQLRCVGSDVEAAAGEPVLEDRDDVAARPTLISVLGLLDAAEQVVDGAAVSGREVQGHAGVRGGDGLCGAAGGQVTSMVSRL